MNTRFRTPSLLAAALGALLVASAAFAGFMPPGSLPQQRDQRTEQKESHQGAHPGRQSEPRARSEPQRQPAPQQSAPRDRPMARYDGQDRAQNGRRDPVAQTRPESPQRGNPGAREGSGWNGHIPNGGSWNGKRFDADRAGGRYPVPDRSIVYRAPPRIVHSLPVGHRSYSWNGAAYYHYGSHWYRPYGASYVMIGAPYGLFVSYLPSYYNSFWYGGVRYFHADSTYYVYEPVRRGYVVSHSPYGDDDHEEPESSTKQDEDLYVYPAQGQSEQQQSDDRYECHRWAVGEAGYDPTDSEYDADRRAGYLRALTACLTGRGYSVR